MSQQLSDKYLQIRALVRSSDFSGKKGQPAAPCPEPFKLSQRFSLALRQIVINPLNYVPRAGHRQDFDSDAEERERNIQMMLKIREV